MTATAGPSGIVRIVPMPVEIAIRAGKPEDHGYVLTTWRTLHERSRAGQELGALYRDRQTRLVLAILRRQSTSLRVAHVPDDVDAILGWACLGPRRVYYAYVRDTVRRQRIASRLVSDLLPGAITTEYTHDTGATRESPILMGARPVVHGVRLPRGWLLDPHCNFPEG